MIKNLEQTYNYTKQFEISKNCDINKVELGILLFVEKLKKKLKEGHTIKLEDKSTFRIIRCYNKINLKKINLNSSLEKYELEFDKQNVVDELLRFNIDPSFHNEIKKHVSETKIKYKYVNK